MTTVAAETGHRHPRMVDGTRVQLLLWGAMTRARARDFMGWLQQLPGLDSQQWRGVRDDEVAIWLVDAPRPLIGEIGLRAADRATNGIDFYQLRLLQSWGAVADAPVANFVLRALRAEAVEAVMRPLIEQMSAVAARDGCLGCQLAADHDTPANLLGVTFWRDEQRFDEYAAWAAQHAWRDVIGPITQDVPLRLLSRRVG